MRICLGKRPETNIRYSDFVITYFAAKQQKWQLYLIISGFLNLFFLISLFPSSIVCTLFPERSTWPHFCFVLRMVRRREEIFQELKKVTIETGEKNNTRISGFPTIKMPILYVVFKSLFATNRTKKINMNNHCCSKKNIWIGCQNFH